MPKKVKKIDPFSLPSVTVINGCKQSHKGIPNLGIYFILSASRVLYIGSSRNMRARTVPSSHHVLKILRSRLAYYKIAWLELSSSSVRFQQEASLIRQFSPPLNRLEPELLEVWHPLPEDFPLPDEGEPLGKPVGVRFVEKVDRALREKVSDRQNYIRKAVERQLKEDGLL